MRDACQSKKGRQLYVERRPLPRECTQKNQITPEFPEKHKFDLDRIKNYIQRYYEQLELEEKIYTTSKLIELISRTITKKNYWTEDRKKKCYVLAQMN